MVFDLLHINADIDYRLMRAVLGIDRSSVSSRLVIIINTVGGIPGFAYRSMQQLNALYSHIEIVVPDKAMSAGTLMCMGADTIYMQEGSSLGPLDLQVPHPIDGGQISTLDIKESTYDIFGLANAVTKQFFDQATRELKLGKVQAANVAHSSAVELLKPMVDKIDPYHLHASYRSAQIGQKYARILLTSRMMRGDFNQAAETSRILAEDYEMHGYAITMEEAQQYLRLNVSNIIDLDILGSVQSLLYSSIDGVNFVPGMTHQIPSPPAKPKKGEKDDK